MTSLTATMTTTTRTSRRPAPMHLRVMRSWPGPSALPSRPCARAPPRCSSEPPPTSRPAAGPAPRLTNI